MYDDNLVVVNAPPFAGVSIMFYINTLIQCDTLFMYRRLEKRVEKHEGRTTNVRRFRPRRGNRHDRNADRHCGRQLLRQQLCRARPGEHHLRQRRQDHPRHQHLRLRDAADALVRGLQFWLGALRQLPSQRDVRLRQRAVQRQVGLRQRLDRPGYAGQQRSQRPG